MLDVDRLLALDIPQIVQPWAERDTVIYNLGIGFGAEAIADPEALRFVLEDRLATFPTMATVPGAAWEAVLDPGLGVRYEGVVHGDETVEFVNPMPVAGPYVGRNRIAAIWDRGPERGAIMQVEKTLLAADGETIIARCRSNLMLRFNGGFGGSEAGAPRAASLPDSAPDGCIESRTLPEQALVYRLSGDRNPLHADPAKARAAGFPGPVLHGLCTLGFATRGLVAAVAGNDETRLAALSLRFSKPVYPGETLSTEYWNLGGGELAFRTSVRAREAVVLTGGRLRLA